MYANLPDLAHNNLPAFLELLDLRLLVLKMVFEVLHVRAERSHELTTLATRVSAGQADFVCGNRQVQLLSRTLESG
jgi:hypothetical protein